MTKFVVPTIFTAIDKFSGPVKGMNSAVMGFAGKTEAAMARAERAYRRLVSPLAGLRNMMNNIGYYVGIYTFIRWIQNAIKVIADFEQANVNLASVMENRDLPLMGDMSYQARLMAVTYGKTASEVSTLQYELIKLGNTGKTVLAMTEAITAGATAFRTTPEKAAETFGAIFKAFRVNLEGDNGSKLATDHIDKLLYVANRTAADFESFATQMPIVSSIASLGNVGYEQIIAMLGATQDLKIHTATASTSVKNMLLDMMKSGDTFESGWSKFMKMSQGKDSILYAFDKFGKKTVVTALGLKQLNDQVREMVSVLQNDPGQWEGLSKRLALEQLDTTWGSLKMFTSAYQEMILALDNGNGPISKALKNYFSIGTALFLLAADSDVARQKLATMDENVKSAAGTFLFWLRVIKWVAIAFVALKAALILASIWTTYYNVTLGISTALGLANARTIIGSTVAMGAHRIMVGLLTLSQIKLNAAMAANPVGLLIIAFAALVTLMYQMVKHWDEWGAALSTFLGPLGSILSIFVSIYRNWDMIVRAFSDGGILEGFRAIKRVLLDSFMYPFQKIYEMIYKITGADWANTMAKAIELTRGSLRNPEFENREEKQKYKPGESAAEYVSRMTAGPEKNWSVDFKNVPPWVQVSGDKQKTNIMPHVGSNQGWNQGASSNW